MSSPVEQIKQRLSVVDVVQSYIKLDKAGANFKARCPFHSEKTASFFVSPPRDIWHCFGCNRGGDIFGFVMEIEGVEFVEALKILAERAGIKLKTEDPRLRNERTRLLDLMKNAVDFYRKKFVEYQEALLYLRKRGLKDSIIQLYGLGYSPPESAGWRNLYEWLLAKGYSDEEIKKSGMVVEADNREKRYYDRFRGRIMFPIFDFSGRAVGFSGRIFPEISNLESNLETKFPSGNLVSKEPAKYINSPQTILYDKSKILYGFDKAKIEIRKKDICVLVEGQMDVLMSHQAEVLNAVAVSGIGLTPHHLDTIGRLTNNLIVCFDNDEAGLIASGRGTDLALEKGFEVKVVSLPFGKDPADVVLKDPLAWQKAVGNSRHIIDFYLQIFSEKIKEPRELKRKVEKVVLPYVNFIESEIDKSHWIKEIARRLDIREEPVWEQLKKLKTPKPGFKEISKPGFNAEAPKTRQELLEERLLGIVFWQNDANIIPGDKRFFFSEKHQNLLKNLEEGKNLTGEDKNYSERFSLEAELSYAGMEDNRMKEETKILLNDLGKEVLYREREAVISDIKKLEAEGKEELLKERLDKFNEINKKLTNKNQ